jgi:hypothetical protein
VDFFDVLNHRDNGIFQRLSVFSGGKSANFKVQINQPADKQQKDNRKSIYWNK